MAKVDMDELSAAIMKELDGFKEVTDEIMTQAVKETAKETAEEIRANAPEKSGEYAESWSYKRNSQSKNHFSMIAYSIAPRYRLSHLLEHGHAIVNGGRKVGSAKAFKHLKKAEENAAHRLQHKIERGIGKGKA